MTKFRITRHALALVSLEPARLGFGVYPIVLTRIYKIFQILINPSRTSEDAFPRHNEMPIERKHMSVQFLTHRIFQHSIDLRPQWVEVITSHIGAVPTIADIMFPIQAHESSIVAELCGQPLVKPILQCGHLVIFYLSSEVLTLLN